MDAKCLRTLLNQYQPLIFSLVAVDVKRGAVQGFVRARRKTENVAPAAAASFVKIFKNSKKKHAQAKETL